MPVHTHLTKEPLHLFCAQDGFEPKSPEGAKPGSKWIGRDLRIENKSYRVGIEQTPIDGVEMCYTLGIFNISDKTDAKAFRLLAQPGVHDVYRWAMDTMTAVLASKHETLDAACAYVQNRLGVTDGGFASHFFSDDDLSEKFQDHSVMLDYLTSEARFNEPSDRIGGMLLTDYQALLNYPGIKASNRSCDVACNIELTNSFTITRASNEMDVGKVNWSGKHPDGRFEYAEYYGPEGDVQMADLRVIPQENGVDLKKWIEVEPLYVGGGCGSHRRKAVLLAVVDRAACEDDARLNIAMAIKDYLVRAGDVPEDFDPSKENDLQMPWNGSPHAYWYEYAEAVVEKYNQPDAPHP